MKKVFIAATGQNAGKTTACLGLMHAFQQRGYKVGFIKPVGQRYVEEEGAKIDEDAVLIARTFGKTSPVKYLNPVSVPQGFTQEYIQNRSPNKLVTMLLEGVETVSAGNDIIIFEGTGHGGVGSVIDLSNAEVARLVNAQVIIISGGGVGRAIDEVCLNRCLFENKKVPLLGVIVNKVLEDKYAKIAPLVKKGLELQGIETLGVVPFTPALSYPSIEQLVEELDLKVIAGKPSMGNKVVYTLIAAMTPQNTVTQMRDHTLVITPGDRVDNLLVALSSHLIRGEMGFRVAGIVLTGGFIPHFSIMGMLKETDIPVLATEQSTYDVASAINSLTVKIGAMDREKIDLAIQLITQHVAIDRILDRI